MPNIEITFGSNRNVTESDYQLSAVSRIRRHIGSLPTPVVAHAWVVISDVCQCVCTWALTEKQLEQSTLGTRHALQPEVKGQGHRVMKCAATMGMHVDMTAEVSISHDYDVG